MIDKRRTSETVQYGERLQGHIGMLSPNPLSMSRHTRMLPYCHYPQIPSRSSLVLSWEVSYPLSRFLELTE